MRVTHRATARRRLLGPPIRSHHRRLSGYLLTVILSALASACSAPTYSRQLAAGDSVGAAAETGSGGSLGTGGGTHLAATAADGTGGASGAPADDLSRAGDAAIPGPGAEASSADASGRETTGEVSQVSEVSMVDNVGVTMIAGASDAGAATSASGRAQGASAASASGTGGANSGRVASTDTAQYSFESSTQSWAVIADRAPFTRIGRSAARHFAGVFSLAVSFAGVSARSSIVEVVAPRGAISPGAVVTFHLDVDAEAQLIAAQPYLIDTAARYLASYAPAASLKVDDWTTLRVRVPSDAATIERIGVKFTAPGVWAGTVYLDSIDW